MLKDHFKAYGDKADPDVEPTSYCSVADADNFLVSKKNGKEWVLLDVDKKENLLYHASIHIDNNNRFIYTKAKEDQFLKFPRLREGYDEPFMPKGIIMATAILANIFKDYEGDFQHEALEGFMTSYRLASDVASREVLNLLLRYKARTMSVNFTT